MINIPEKELHKLIAILGKLGSDHAGERDAAGLMAHRIVSRYGTWDMLFRDRITVFNKCSTAQESKSTNSIRTKRRGSYPRAIELLHYNKMRHYYAVYVRFVVDNFKRSQQRVNDDATSGKVGHEKYDGPKRCAKYSDAIDWIINNEDWITAKYQQNIVSDLVDMVAFIFNRSTADVFADYKVKF